MNIVKGIDRIAIVVAIGLAIVAFFPFLDILKEPYQNPDYEVWESKRNHRVGQLEDFNPFIRATPRESQYPSLVTQFEATRLPREEVEKRKAEREIREKVRREKERERESILNADKELQQIIASQPPTMLGRPICKKILLSALGSLAVFLGVFLGICGTTRGVKRLGLWIIQGFKS